MKNSELVPKTAIKYKFSKKLSVWVRTWFTIEKGEDGVMFFMQRNAFSRDRNAELKFWTSKPIK